MTKRQKEKQAAHNARKDSMRRKLSEKEMAERFADLRKQEAAANARLKEGYDNLEDAWYNWVATHNLYTVPRLCAGFYYAALQAAKKRLIKSQVELFMDEMSAAMQEIVNEAGSGSVNATFEEIREKLEAEGYAVPEWAQPDDFEHVKELAKNGGRE